MKTLRSLDIGSRLADRRLTYELDEVTRRADALFFKTSADPALAQYVVSLPLAGVPDLRAALPALLGQPSERPLEDAVRKVITRGWRKLSSSQINRAVDVYLQCLCQALPTVQSQTRMPIETSALCIETETRALRAEAQGLRA
jgi:hypothetical protein